ncbi:pentapeptide repeat protein [Methanosarcina sp. MTP4]|uniref:pentapeptide repeat-containing protein n=1 Tax=Methanosarcina sp. MTP4 TaxID=1434100 RepID=UPI000615920A|nr:pentapeptide repeat-containing protein [Methanosarcina sp. MTP4]AKB24486.1 pentapeptide repeat protein [Methanosarcina sp. MTP4]
MVTCKYIYWVGSENYTLIDFHCPFEAVEGDELCYWHQAKDGKKPSQEQLDELKKIDFDFVGIYLKRAELKNVSLDGVKLPLANFTEAKLNEISLECAELSNSKFEDADLTEANLQRSKLESVDFEGAILRFANLTGATLTKANLTCANLNHSKVSNADLSYATMEGIKLIEMTLSGSKLDNVVLINEWLDHVDLKDADLSYSTLCGTQFNKCNLQNANLSHTDLRGAELLEVNLQNSDLSDSLLQGANLSLSNLRGSDLSRSNLQGTFLGLTLFNSDSCLNNVSLAYSNIHRSYIDESRTLRDCVFFENGVMDMKEINEFVADNLAKKLILDAEAIRKSDFKLFHDFEMKGLLRYPGSFPDNSVIFYDDLTDSPIKKRIDNIVFKNTILGKSRELENFVPTFYVSRKYLYRGNKKDLYNVSHEVYNKLYNFYSSSGDTLRARQVHYRRGEVYRKLLLARGGYKNKLRALAFDGFILKTLAGYGDKIWNPIKWSFFIIGSFSILFWLTNGVSIEERSIHWYDYLYLSVTAFTGLGFSNVQPNISELVTFIFPLVGTMTISIPQILVMAESVLGFTMVSLIIFVITYQISR